MTRSGRPVIFKSKQHRARPAIFFLAGLSIAAPAKAEMATRDLIAACRAVVDANSKEGVPNDLKSGICVGFFAAITGTLLYEDDTGRRMLGICTPDHLNTLALLNSTERFVANNPTTMSDRAIIVALSAAKHDFPCNQPTNSR